MGGSDDRTEQIAEFEKRSRQIIASRIIDKRLNKWYRISLITRLGSSNLGLISLCILFLTIVPVLYLDREYYYMILMAVILTTSIFLAIWFPLRESSSLDGYLKKFEDYVPTIGARVLQYISVKDLSYQTIDDIEWGEDKKNMLFIISSQDEIRISLWEYEEGTLVHIGPVRGTTLETIHSIKRAIDKGK